MKRYFYLFIIVAAVVLVVLIGYFLRYRAGAPNPSPEPAPGGLPNVGTQTNPAPSPSGQTPGTTSGGNVPIYAGQKFGVVADNKVLSFYVDSQNNAILVQPDGQVVKITAGKAATLSSAAVSSLIDAQFSYDGNKILVSLGDPTNPQFSIFDVASKSWQPLQLNIKAATWSPTNYQIAYLGDKGGIKTLTTFDLTGTKAKPATLLNIHAEDLVLNWMSADQFILSDKGSAMYGGSLWSFSVKNKTLAAFAQNQPGLDSLWDSRAGMGLVFAADASRRGGKLTLLDAAGNVLHGLSFTTFPSKCVFDVTVRTPTSTTPAQQATSSKTSSKTAKPASPPPPILEKTLYCAVPRDNQKFGFAKLPDDYEKKVVFTADDFYRINLGDGSVSQVYADKAQELDAVNPRVFNQTLFFINRLDQKLYAISLK